MRSSTQTAVPNSPIASEKTSRKHAYGLFFICAALLMTSSCGGGGSSTGSTGGQGSSPGTVSFSTNTISFKAAGPFAQAPATQTVTGTVTGVTAGTVYVTIQVNNPNSFFTVTNPSITGNSGQVNVVPAMPSSLQVGSFSGSVTVSICLNDPTCKTGQLTGSPQIISVAYNVGSGVDGNTVTPRVVAANAAGTAILRGAGFTGATDVSFGSFAATSISVVSDSEIDVSYPVLAAGTYPITINSGGISYTASLVAISPPAFAQTLIPYPSGVVAQGPSEIEYDPQRTALFVLASVPTSGPPSPMLLRYAFDGSAWGPPTELSIQFGEEFHLSPDGTHLLLLVQSDASASMVELDPVSLAQTNITVLPLSPYTCGFELANDGNAIVGVPSAEGLLAGFVFGTFSRVATPMPYPGDCPTVASGNGALVAMGNANYISAKETITQPGTAGTSADLIGDKFLNGDAVQDQTGQVLGYLSTPYNVLNWAGTRAYGYAVDPNSCVGSLSTFDLTSTPSGSPNPQFPVLGTPITFSNSCFSGGYLLAITPDGATVFLGRPDGLVVQPIP